MRGSYTLGILDVFLENRLFFPYVIGVSAGACNAASYVSRQIGRGERIAETYGMDRRYVSPLILLGRGHSMFGMDFIFDEIPDVHDPFDYDAFYRTGTHMVIGCTDVVTGKALYVDTPPRATLNTYYRASSSIPLFSPMVHVDGYTLLDGGTADPIPFDEALRHAAVALAALGAADFRAFWSTLVTVDAPGRFVAGLLRACPHAWCAHTPRARALLARPPLRGAVLGARDVVVRALCRAESAAACVSAPAHAQYLRALGWTDAPALIAACALFGPLAPNPCDEDAFVRAVRALLADEPLVARPLLAECAKIAPAIIATLSLDDSTKKEEKEEDDDNEMDSLLDAVATLAAFFRVATVCTAPFVRAGLFPQLSRCYAAVSARLMQGDATTPAAATATDVLRAIEACAASALMFAWLAVFAGASEHVPPPAAADMEESNSEDTKDKEAAREKMRREAATGLLAFVRTAGDTTEGALVRALDDRCDLGARVRALAAQHRDVFPRADVDAALRALGRSTATTSKDEEAFPALPTTGVDQLLSLFPGGGHREAREGARGVRGARRGRRGARVRGRPRRAAGRSRPRRRGARSRRAPRGGLAPRRPARAGRRASRRCREQRWEQQQQGGARGDEGRDSGAAGAHGGGGGARARAAVRGAAAAAQCGRGGRVRGRLRRQL